MQKKSFEVKKLALGGMIAALYVCLTLLSNALGLALGPFQIRFSEALVILPFFTSAAVPGLFGGCLLANLICGAHIMDIIFGSLATLLGAMGTYHFRKKPVFAYLSPVVANGVMIPPILYYVYGLYPNAFFILLAVFLVGEVLSAVGLGYLLKRALTPLKKHFL